MYPERECETGDYCLIQPAVVGLLWYCWTYGRHVSEVAAYTEPNGIVHSPQSTKYQTNSSMMPTIKFPSRITAAARLSDSSSQIKSQSEAQSQTPCILSQREQEMNQTLQEALACTSCPIHLSKADMDQDMQSGTYDPTRDPPFLASCRPHSRPRSSFSNASSCGHDSDYASSSPYDHARKSPDMDMDEDMEQQDEMDYEDVSPLDTPKPTTTRPKYAGLTTPSQRQQYQACVLEALSETIGPLGSTGDDWEGSCSPKSTPTSISPALTLADVESTVDEDDMRFACYRVDYHIQLHERARSSMLSICRDIDDVWQLRGWQTEVRQLDREVLGMDVRGGKEDGLLDVHQMAIWRRGWRERERRVCEVRKTWAGIVAERRKQRARILREKRDRGGKIRFYTRQEGDRVLLREFSL